MLLKERITFSGTQIAKQQRANNFFFLSMLHRDETPLWPGKFIVINSRVEWLCRKKQALGKLLYLSTPIPKSHFLKLLIPFATGLQKILTFTLKSPTNFFLLSFKSLCQRGLTYLLILKLQLKRNSQNVCFASDHVGQNQFCLFWGPKIKFSNKFKFYFFLVFIWNKR